MNLAVGGTGARVAYQPVAETSGVPVQQSSYEGGAGSETDEADIYRARVLGARPPGPGELLFNLKLTDLTTVDNPFVVYEDRKVDEHGYLLFADELRQDPADRTLRGESKGASRPAHHTFRNADIHRSVEGPLDSMRTGASLGDSQANNNVLDPVRILPWLSKASDLEKRTLKIEVTYQGELILLRIIHLDRLYPVQYPQIALQIANNMVQNHLLRQEQRGLRAGAPEALGRSALPLVGGSNAKTCTDGAGSPLGSTQPAAASGEPGTLPGREARGAPLHLRTSEAQGAASAGPDGYGVNPGTSFNFWSNQQTVREGESMPESEE